MALVDEVALRYTSQVLIELTNPRTPSATSTDSTKLAQAAASVLAYFKMLAQETYDSTVAIHVEVAVRGVVALLQSWGGVATGVFTITWDAWKEECREMRGTRARARMLPVSTSVLTPSVEGTGTVRPAFDIAKFDALIPGQGTSVTPSSTD